MGARVCTLELVGGVHVYAPCLPACTHRHTALCVCMWYTRVCEWEHVMSMNVGIRQGISSVILRLGLSLISKLAISGRLAS